MRLDQLLVLKGFCESRTEAQELISLGYISVDGNSIQKQTRQVEESAEIKVAQRRKFVSRGGDKLEAALIHVYGTQDLIISNFLAKKAIDIGSSTGGFTDCLLSHGVTSVTAIDVGTTQLHTKLRSDARVSLFENTDIKNFVTTNSFDIIVADLSFIALEKVFDIIISFGKKNSIYFLLIKPQFEVGKGKTKKGIVKDSKLLSEVIQKYTLLAKVKKLKKIVLFPCEVLGGDGNQEYFLYAEK